MSASITVHCDREFQYGTCTAQLITDALTIPEARAAADRTGWRSHPDGRDYCPAHSGRPGGPRTTVVTLHERTRP